MAVDNNDKFSLLDKIIRFCLVNKLVVVLAMLVIIGWGLLVAPFDWELAGLPRDPVPVDAIPDIGENQQIVFTRWMGRSPQDVQDQITYPLTVTMMGMPGVKNIRSTSAFGFSSILIIFDEDIEFYWSRSRVLEKLNSLPSGTLPEGVQPSLGPDATPLGQIFWYTIEGRDKNGNPTGGWDLHELRTVQDWNVKLALLSARGVSEVASVGGFVQEYQIDVKPDAMWAAGVTLEDVFKAVQLSNVDVGARTIEVNRVEYVIRGLGFIKKIEDIEKSVIKVNDNVPIFVKDVATVSLGPALRRGALDKDGAEVVGGVVVVRYGFNPLEAIKNVKAKIKEISPGLPQKTLPDGTVSQLKIVPFYDRTGLIYETLGTLNKALSEEILVTIIVVIMMVMHLKSSILISGVIPLAVLMCFIGMKLFGVDANIVALSGIAIAIGTIVDMGVIVCENILKHLDRAAPGEDRFEVIFRAVREVGSAVLTAVSTTVISFLPVFTMTAAEGKLFKPLAYTKTFALIASIVVALTMLPPIAHILFTRKISRNSGKITLGAVLATLGIIVIIFWSFLGGLILIAFGVRHIVELFLPQNIRSRIPLITNFLIVVLVALILAGHWSPVGPQKGLLLNFIFVAMLIGSVLLLFYFIQRIFGTVLAFLLRHKALFLTVPVILILAGFNILLGLGKEFMPPLDEGSYLYMPSTMPHASIGESLDALQKQDMAIRMIPEVDNVVGKIGRADSPLDPAPISMVETVVNYKPEYISDKAGHRIRFKYDRKNKKYSRDKFGELIPDKSGRPYRQWRDDIKSADDIWDEIVRAAQMPGSTGAPKLQPISTRLVMLQSGMRSPMGIKIKGPDLETIEKVGLDLEKLIKEVPSIKAPTVFAERIVGKPYIEIDIDREAIARYGIKLMQVQRAIEIAIGGRQVTTTFEGRERFPVRVRYQRELRDSIETLGKILIGASGGAQIPLIQLAEIRYTRGPQMIKSEDTFLVGYLTFDKKDGHAEVDVVEEAQAYLEQKIDSGELVLPAGVSYKFAGTYENQVRSAKTLTLVLPVALLAIFLILYFQFKAVPTTLLVFSGIFIAWSGGFIMIWLYGQDWFLNFSIFGMHMRELFQVHPFNLSVAVWVGFLALFGIASDNGVIMTTFLEQTFSERNPDSIEHIRATTIEAAKRRMRPCLMTSATTILALIPVLTSTGRGADIMVPMAIPSFGGMTLVLISLFTTPVIYCAIREFRFKRNQQK
jgi:copper/silver efflux system protein